MPLLFRPGGNVVVVTPLNILGAQNKERLTKLGITAISVDAESATPKNLQDIESGAYRVVVINPEIAFKEKGAFERIWRTATSGFAQRLQVTASDWQRLAEVQHRLQVLAGYLQSPGDPQGRLASFVFFADVIPRSVPYLLPSATLPTHVLDDVMDILQIKRENTHIIRRSNDRPNIYLSVRKIQHPLHSFKDLNFLIPDGWKPGDRIRKFVVFFDNKTESIAAADYLRSRLPLAHRDKILWFNADNTPARRELSTDMLKDGQLYGLTCTDAFGMGVDLKDIEIIVQWRCFCDLDTLWQRFGRAARGRNTEGLAVFFAEPKYFDDVKAMAAQRAEERQRKADEKASAEEQRKRKKPDSSASEIEAESSKRQRIETRQVTNDMCQSELSTYEQLRVEFRRTMPTAAQQGKVKKTAVAKELGPELDAVVKDSAAPRASKVNKTYDIQPMDAELQRALHDFRRTKATAKYGAFMLRNVGAGLIMGDETIQRIIDCARAYKLRTVEDLQRETKWARCVDMGDEVLAIVNRHYPQPSPKPPPDPPPPPSDVHLDVPTTRTVATRSCKTCGATDHIASNKKCPGYEEYQLKKTLSKKAPKRNVKGSSVAATEPSTSESASIHRSPSRVPLSTIISPLQSPSRRRIQDAGGLVSSPIPFRIPDQVRH
ncbi:hypothetical protein EIP86_004313 [Pleurotus ostreatoroseus]|nr:hypothetical protein EIP86_004313 [Pleurotus ostreatoroseus]